MRMDNGGLLPADTYPRVVLAFRLYLVDPGGTGVATGPHMALGHPRGSQPLEFESITPSGYHLFTDNRAFIDPDGRDSKRGPPPPGRPVHFRD